MTDLPTPPAIRKAKKAELVAWAESFGLNAEGKVDELRARLLEHVASAAKAPKAEKKAAKPEAPKAALPPEPAEEIEEPSDEEEGEEEEAEAKEAEKEEKKAKGKEKEERGHTPKLKPQLTAEIRALLRLRRQVANRRPTFRRQEWFTHAGLGQMWRKPQGQHSKLRRHLGYRPNVVSIGYRGPKAVRGLHPSGFREVLVHRVRDLDAIDPKLEAARISGTVGGRRRVEIESAADEKGIRVLNRREEE